MYVTVHIQFPDRFLYHSHIYKQSMKISSWKKILRESRMLVVLFTWSLATEGYSFYIHHVSFNGILMTAWHRPTVQLYGKLQLKSATTHRVAWDIQGYVFFSSFLLRYPLSSPPPPIWRLTATCLWSTRKPLGLCCQGWRMRWRFQSSALSGPRRGGIGCRNVMMYLGVK